ncbi:DinB family protein [Streptomyces yaizuensis]|uniref:DinB family protein n=1 Tax=Streptomyces yaizuensis TaxID=2989713 RepID=A0ABQ5P2V0_9ACTN|nr:DinB family protein [Streptomyces sp. YSPA8]GLF96929.1 DinB family protein [Streptomyces sp. YSPA8]
MSSHAPLPGHPAEDPAGLPERHFGGPGNMFLSAADDPRGGLGHTGELAVLAAFLRDQRLTLELKCSGLDADALARRPVPPSNLSLLGLVRHLAHVEQSWFRRILAGQDVPYLYRTEADRDTDFNGAVADPQVVAEAWRTWRAEVANAERYVAAGPDLASSVPHGGKRVTVREVLVHMIEEYARHNGHADLLRERIDGRVGE